MRLGRLLQLWRRREALTLKAAAAKIGINPSTLGRIERGESMHGATLTTVLVWLMGREEPSANEAFTFESEDAVAVEHQVAERNAAPGSELSSSTCEFSGEEAGAGESSSNTCELGIGEAACEPRIVASPGITASVITVDGSVIEFQRRQRESAVKCFAHGEPPILHFVYESRESSAEAHSAAIADKPEAGAEHPVHAVDQDAALCGVREERGGGSAHGGKGAGAESAG